MSQIASLQAREILDGQGYPTIEVQATLSSGVSKRSSAPPGMGDDAVFSGIAAFSHGL